jgi:hypothetical protein
VIAQCQTPNRELETNSCRRQSNAAIDVLIILLALVCAGLPARAAEAISPAMKKLFRTFVGHWAVNETFARGEFFPKGGTRTRTAHFTVGTGGTSLIEDYHSGGSAGKLDFLMVIWWDANTKRYRVFTCSNGAGGELRGTAHWESGVFVNDYEGLIDGKSQKFQDCFSQPASGSFTLVAGIYRSGKTFEPLITTTYKRVSQLLRSGPNHETKADPFTVEFLVRLHR